MAVAGWSKLLLLAHFHAAPSPAFLHQVNDGSNMSGIQVVVEPGVEGWQLVEAGSITTGGLVGVVMVGGGGEEWPSQHTQWHLPGANCQAHPNVWLSSNAKCNSSSFVSGMLHHTPCCIQHTSSATL